MIPLILVVSCFGLIALIVFISAILNAVEGVGTNKGLIIKYSGDGKKSQVSSEGPRPESHESLDCPTATTDQLQDNLVR